MKGVKKSNRVSWANEANLCQVKIFQSEDCPYEVCREPHGNPQEKVSNANITIFDGCPGSSVGSYSNLLSHKDVSHIPQIQWSTPPRFKLRSQYRVAAGEESEEVEVQKHREMRELEAVYPHFSAIPPCPLISPDVDAEHFDDWRTPVIPVIAIEEAVEMSCLYNKIAALNIFMKSELAKLPQSPSPSEVFDIPQSKPLLSPQPSNGNKSDYSPWQVQEGPMVAATAAADAIIKSKEPGSLIDPDTLIKLLSNPKLVEKLIDEHGLRSDTTTGTSGSRTVESSVRCPSSKGRFPFEESTIESCKPDIPRTEFIHRPSRVKDSLAAPSRSRAQVASTETEPTSAWNEVEQSLHFQNSSIDSLVQKYLTKNIQPGNAGNEALLRLGNQHLADKAETGTGLGPKQVTTSISLLGSKSDLPSQNSNYEDFQTVDAGYTSFLKASDTLSSSPPDFLSKKSTGKHIQLANNGHMTVPRLVKRAAATNIEIGANSRSKTLALAPFVPLLSSNPDFPGKNFMKEHSQLANFRDLSVPGFVKPTPAGSSMSGTAFESKQVTPSAPLSSVLPDFSQKSSRQHGPHLYTSFPEPAIEKHSHTFPQMQAESLVDRLDTAYIAPRPGTSTKPLAEVYHIKKLIAEHGLDDRAGNDYVCGVPPPSSVLGAERPYFPRKDISYIRSLIKQHGEEKENQDGEISDNQVQSEESDQNYKKTCKFYNSSKGCRNGFSCPYQHDIPGRWRSDIVLEEPGAKRMKFGGIFTEKT